MADTKASFIENVNILANATKAATGDIVEDAELAKNEALEAAKQALNYSLRAKTSEELSREWSEKEFNNDITGYPGHRSAFHWSEIAKQNAGSTVIVDDVTSSSRTWSSQKINDLLNIKSDVSHSHDNLYMPKVIEGSAYNKNFQNASEVGAGSSVYVARADHAHPDLYEPKRQTFGTAYNKNFGTASDEVARGDHAHTEYMLTEAWTTNGLIKSSTLPWVADVLNPQSAEIPRGDHTHKSENISYEPLPESDYPVVTSTTVQGALAQLDRKYSIIDIVEKNFITAGLSVEHEVPISGIDTPVNIDAPLAVNTSKNTTITNGSRIKVEYPADKTPKKFIEGVYSITVVLKDTTSEDVALSVSVGDVFGAGMVIIGEHSSGTSRTLSFSKHLTGLSADGFTISPMITNRTNTNNIFIDSINIMWVGAPEGALVASGTSVDHSDLTGTGAPNGVHTISDIQDLQLGLDAKADKVSSGIAGNFISLDTFGNLVDSGVAAADSEKIMHKVEQAVLDNIVVQTATGDANDGGLKISDLALKDGLTTQVFNVGIATAGEHAIRKQTFDDTVATLSTKEELQAHTALPNPHNTTYSDVGAAAAAHQHAISDVTSLQDTLDNKYNIISDAGTNNIVIFGSSSTVKDSGVQVDTLINEVVDKISSDISQGGSVVNNIIAMSQSDYDLITTPDANTVYLLWN